MRIIPAIDIIDGKCVRLTKGDYELKKIYNEDPLEVAKQFQDTGLEYLHLVDLDGARQGRVINYKQVEKIAVKTNLKIDFGGGLKSDEDLKIIFQSGANQITSGSIAVKEPELFCKWLQLYGAEKIILGADVVNLKIAINAWQSTTKLAIIEFIADYVEKGIQYTICTDISKDGMLNGPSDELYKNILEKNQVKLIASGGITSVDDLCKIKEIGCEGAIIGKAIYENRISLPQLYKFNNLN